MVDCALEILEMCARWVPKEEITNFGPTYLYFITLAGNELVSALGDGGGEGVVSIDELITLFRTVGDALFMGELHEQHVTRVTGKSLFYNCDQLAMMKSWRQ